MDQYHSKINPLKVKLNDLKESNLKEMNLIKEILGQS